MTYRLRWNVEVYTDDNPLHFGAGQGPTPDEALDALAAYLRERREREYESIEWSRGQLLKLQDATIWVEEGQ